MKQLFWCAENCIFPSRDMRSSRASDCLARSPGLSELARLRPHWRQTRDPQKPRPHWRGAREQSVLIWCSVSVYIMSIMTVGCLRMRTTVLEWNEQDFNCAQKRSFAFKNFFFVCFFLQCNKYFKKQIYKLMNKIINYIKALYKLKVVLFDYNN